MITFKFVDEVTGRKQDVNCSLLPVQDNTCHIYNVNCYVYNQSLSRIEFFGCRNYYYNHENREWNTFILPDDDVELMDCIEIVIK